MRILLVNDYAPGTGFGAEVHLSLLLEGLSAAGDTVEVFSSSPGARGFRVLDLWNPTAKRRLAVLCERFGPDVIHIHNMIRELSPSVFMTWRHAAQVMTVHDHRLLGTPDGPVGRPMDPLALRTLKSVSASLARSVARRSLQGVIAPSSYMVDRLRARGFQEVHLVPYFTRAGPEPRTNPSEHADILFVGRLSVDKGVHLLIDAFGRIARSFPNTQLVLAGDGPDRARFEGLAASTAIGRVRFLGSVPNDKVRAAMDAARVVAVPSLKQEGAPIVAIEAALAGRPVVASDDPGLRELLQTDSFGRVVPRGDVGALADELAAVLTDPDGCDHMGREARRIALKTWTLEVGIPRTREIYRRAQEVFRADEDRRHS